jgi:hypothetical protein
MTPVIKRAMAAFEKANPLGDAWHHVRVEARRSGVSVSTYIEGYIKKRTPGRVSTYQSVGGDYNIPYQETPDREETKRVMVSLWVEIGNDGTVTIEHRHPDSREGHDVIFQGRGFGKKAASVVAGTVDTFRRWRKRFEEEDV